MARSPRKSTLEKEVEFRRFHNDTDAIKLHREEVVLWPKLWSRRNISLGLEWNVLPFSRATRSRVPRTKGLYAFAVQASVTDLPPHSWLFYIGEVGAGSSEDRTLWKRYGEYLGELDRVTRPKMSMLLERYKGYVQFYYCEIDPEEIDLKALESELITAAWPYANIKDFDVQYGPVRRAFS